MSRPVFLPKDKRIFSWDPAKLPERADHAQECQACHRMATGSDYCTSCRGLAARYLETGDPIAERQLMLVALVQLKEDATYHVRKPPVPPKRRMATAKELFGIFSGKIM